jgi:hypothetical protein
VREPKKLGIPEAVREPKKLGIPEAVRVAKSKASLGNVQVQRGTFYSIILVQGTTRVITFGQNPKARAIKYIMLLVGLGQINEKASTEIHHVLWGVAKPRM